MAKTDKSPAAGKEAPPLKACPNCGGTNVVEVAEWLRCLDCETDFKTA